MDSEELMKGAFVSSLKRSNGQIKADRAESIAEDTQVAFQRQVEDLALEIKRKKRERTNMLDLSPTNSMSLMVADEFDSQAFVTKDNEIGLKIRELEIKYEISKERYEYLFGGK